MLRFTIIERVFPDGTVGYFVRLARFCWIVSADGWARSIFDPLRSHDETAYRFHSRVDAEAAADCCYQRWLAGRKPLAERQTEYIPKDLTDA